VVRPTPRPLPDADAHVRTALWIGTLVAIRHSPTLRQFYARRLAAGKPEKVALTASMHKLLTILNALLSQPPSLSP